MYWSTYWCVINPIVFLHSFSFFYLLWMYNFQHPVFELTDSSAQSNPCWSFYYIFLFLHYIFQFQNLLGSFLMMSIFLLNFLLFMYHFSATIELPSLFCYSTFCFFKIIILKFYINS
jgi:hypothetical protein